MHKREDTRQQTTSCTVQCTSTWTIHCFRILTVRSGEVLSRISWWLAFCIVSEWYQVFLLIILLVLFLVYIPNLVFHLHSVEMYHIIRLPTLYGIGSTRRADGLMFCWSFFALCSTISLTCLGWLLCNFDTWLEICALRQCTFQNSGASPQNNFQGNCFFTFNLRALSTHHRETLSTDGWSFKS